VTRMYTDSVSKNIAQLAVVADAPIAYNNNVLMPPDTLAISQTFWRSYKCKLGCGGCCFNFSIDWLPNEWECARDTYPFLEQIVTRRDVMVNGAPREIFSILPAKHLKICQFLNTTDGCCEIHQVLPYSCHAELIKFRIIGKRGYIMKTSYGRAWQMRRVVDGGPVLCEFCQFSLDQLVNNDIPVMKQLENWASYFGISTYLPKVIEVLNAATKMRYADKVVIADNTDSKRIKLW